MRRTVEEASPGTARAANGGLACIAGPCRRSRRELTTCRHGARTKTGPASTECRLPRRYREGPRQLGHRGSAVSVNRYYDPATGQFLTDDPLVAVTLAPYRYVSDDPVNVTDPDGLGFCLLGHNPDGSCRGSGLAKDYEAGGGLHASAKILGYESAGIAAVASGGALAVTDAATIEALSFGADAATGVSIAADGAAVADDLATHACSRTTGADVLSTVFGLAAIPVGAFVGSVATGLRPFISPISRGTAQLIGKFTSGIALGTGDWISGSLSNGG